jgi:phosphopantetheinyl transferase
MYIIAVTAEAIALIGYNFDGAFFHFFQNPFIAKYHFKLAYSLICKSNFFTVQFFHLHQDMPLVYQQNINHHCKIGVWHITENEDFFSREVPVSSAITHLHKRLQHYAGRYLLKTLYPSFPLDIILIADTRKPYLVDEAYHFSISHCGDYAAALVSTRERVGVDIETPHPKIGRIVHKFLSDHEKMILHALPLSLFQQYTLGWSIKESLFKWLGSGQVDFIRHLNIISVQCDEQLFIASCGISKNNPVPLMVHCRFVEGNCLSWVVGLE